MKPLFLRHLPQTATTIPGRQKIAAELIDFVKNYDKQKKKAVLLHGPSGVGKTTLVSALANECDAELFELNASDKRNKGAMEDILLPVITTQSFFSQNKIILMDEIDGVSGTKDRGAAASLSKIVAQSKYPIIMTANDGYADKLKALRKVAKVVSLEPLPTKDVLEIVTAICQKEGITAPESVLRSIITKNIGDLRGTLNDIEVVSILNKTIDEESVLDLSERMKMQSLEEALALIFKTMDAHVALRALDNVQAEYRDWFSWIEYNMPKEYTSVLDRAKAFGAISRADVFMGRISNQQYWRLLVYVKDLLTAGVALSKKQPYTTPASYKQSSRGLQIWMLRNKQAKKRAIATRLAEVTHTSAKQVVQHWDQYQPVLMDPKVQESLELDDDQIAWLQKAAA